MKSSLMDLVYAGPSGTFVSGVGCYDIDSLGNPPSDSTLRWDDEAYLSTMKDEIPVMQPSLINGCHDFVLHDACWHLLQRAFQIGEISLKRLLEVSESLPFPLAGIGVCWGHDYGNLFVSNDDSHYPWEDSLMWQLNDETDVFAKENPYNVPEIPAILVMRLEHPPECLPKQSQDDCFSKLPWEVLEAIVINLPTSDALGLRCVSSAFLQLVSSSTFWASRFEPNSDRGFVFEGCSRDATDWRSLYRLTNQAHSPPGLRNRQRIWNLIKPLTNLTSLRLAENPKTSYIYQELDCSRWSKVTGDIKDEASDGHPIAFNEGCRLFCTHIARMPKDLLKIGFSISSIEKVTYITGIRLIIDKGTDVCLGFISKGKEVICEAIAIKGFILAIGSRGIHAMKVVNKDASLSEWAGCPNNSPITKRLARFDCIAALEVGFDVSTRL